MAATSVPQLIAYAETVGYSGYRGLSTAGPSLLAWGLTTGSPYMNSGVTAITALMAKTDLGGDSYVAEHGEDAYVKLVAAYSLYVGLASILLAVIGFGSLAQQVPKPVRTGFKWGCSVGVLVSALPNGLFAKGTRELNAHIATSVVAKVIRLIKLKFASANGAVNVITVFFGILNPQLWSFLPTMVFLTGTIFILKAKDILPKICPPGTEVILVTAAATLFSIFYGFSGDLVGEIPALDPNSGMSLMDGRIKIPIELLDVKELIQEVPITERFGNSWIMLMMSAFLFAGVNFLSIMGIASGFEAEDCIPWSAPRELVSQGVSCVVAGVCGSAPVSGSLSRSLVSRMTGATSQMACLVTAISWIYLLPYMSIMSDTPKAALSAVIVSAVLVGICIPKDLMKLRGLEAVIGWGTGLATAFTSPTIGFGLGLALYMSTVGAVPTSTSAKLKKV
jgi:sulfate permease, SulP family